MARRKPRRRETRSYSRPASPIPRYGAGPLHGAFRRPRYRARSEHRYPRYERRQPRREELQAGRIDVMHVGLSSVIKVNQSGGDLRFIGSLVNVMRFTFFSAHGVDSAADLKGGTIGISRRLGKRFRDHARLAEARSRPQRRRHQGSRQRTRARGLEIREIKAAGSTTCRVGGAPGRPECAGRSRSGADPVAIHRHRRAPRRHWGAARSAHALSESQYRRQLYRAQRREEGQAGAGERSENHHAKILDVAYRDFVAQSPPNLEPSLRARRTS